jgi:hypothetical protein
LVGAVTLGNPETGIHHELQALGALAQQFTLDPELVDFFSKSLTALGPIFERVGVGGEGEFRAGRTVILGFINHTYHLLAGGLQSLQVGNSTVWSACLRGLMETFGACVLISEHPKTAPRYLEHVKAGQLRAAAERGKPGLGRDIDRLNQIVHPASGAVFASFKSVDSEGRIAHIPFGLHPLTADQAQEGTVVLANVADLIVKRLAKLSSQPEVLAAGKLIMVRTSSSATRG